MTGDFSPYPNDTATAWGYYYYPQPWYVNPPNDVCPGCGRCNQCGRGETVRPYITWEYNPIYNSGSTTGSNDTNIQVYNNG